MAETRWHVTFTDEELDAMEPELEWQRSERQRRRLAEQGVFKAVTPRFRDRGLTGYYDTDLELLPEVEWLVEDLVEAEGLTVLGGAPGSGKTFVAMDLAMSLASGMEEWNGKALPGEETNVLYLMAEGFFGAPQRVRAWKIRAGIPEAETLRSLMWTSANINLVRGQWELDVAAVEREIEFVKPRLIVIDTLSRVTGGIEENSAGEMGALIGTVTGWQRTHGTAVLLVHHSTKEGSSFFRGSGALVGAADVAVAMRKEEHERYVMTWRERDTKVKNAQAPPNLEMQAVVHGPSIVLEKADPIVVKAGGRPRSDEYREWVEAMEDPEFAELSAEAMGRRLGVTGRTVRNWLKEGVPEPVEEL